MRKDEFDYGHTAKSLFKSLLWVHALICCHFFFLFAVDVIRIDFIAENPHRSQLHAALLPFVIAAMLLVTYWIFVFLCLGPSQILLLVLIRLSQNCSGRASLSMILAAVPLLAVVTWYSYDYLTPSNFNLGINEGADWEPYVHGITLKGYLGALAAQSFVAPFSYAQYRLKCRGQHNESRNLVLVAIGCFSLLGVLHVLHLLAN